MSADGPANKPASPPHEHGPHCTHCGSALQTVREYTVDDRFLQVLLLAVSEQMGVSVTKAKRRATFRVQADAAALDQFAARVQILSEQLDDRLMSVAQDFVREHTGRQVQRRAR